MSTSPLHVVLGAGPAGSTLVRELASRGLRVRHVNLSPIDDAPDEVETVEADVSSVPEATRATEGAAAIYHAVNVPYHQQVSLMPGIGQAVVAAAAQHSARLVVLDTLYPYGEADPTAITEQTPWAASTRKGLMRAELDQMYLDAHHAGTVEVVLGRSADFYGPRVLNSTLGGAFFPAALSGGQALAFGDITLPHSYSYLPDVARGLAELGTTDRGLGRIWHLPTVPAVSTARVHELVGQILGRAVSVDVVAKPEPVGPFDELFMSEYEEMFYQHVLPQNMVSAAFEREFGLTPTPLEDGLRTTIDWYAESFASRA
ncbi:NAD-dependent epimerase/dehydratase family protein [Luteipulveratus mongoliensis]|uniref:Epimerase n=1 Tax=Luteipulveratus mongoliensis TaxID=571913 RepID=A0A0K1JDN4_9MICO|nr:NAD-dependent epimerase/dehydratase family protein [Luteipulveratus mongoliensis]AKU14827.1 epimerase [Luteipulveratus mongoliensis]